RLKGGESIPPPAQDFGRDSYAPRPEYEEVERGAPAAERPDGAYDDSKTEYSPPQGAGGSTGDLAKGAAADDRSGENGSAERPIPERAIGGRPSLDRAGALEPSEDTIPPGADDTVDPKGRWDERTDDNKAAAADAPRGKVPNEPTDLGMSAEEIAARLSD